MKRREFVRLLAATVPALSLTCYGQQVRMPRVGVLALQDPEPFWTAFRAGLRELGYAEGKNIHVELRIADGVRVSLDVHAADLVRNNFDVIATIQNAPAVAAKRATTDIPIVLITSGDPITSGLVASLARPEGNVTGMSGAAPTGKAVAVLREIVPNLRRIAALLHQPNPAFGNALLEQVESFGRSLGVTVRPIWIDATDDMDAAFRDLAKDRIDAVVLQGSLPRVTAELALKYRVPAAASSSRFAGTDVLVNYAQDAADVSRKAAVYVDRILKGAKPADLPIQEPTKFELVINQRTARALGLTVPRSVLLRATNVIA
ncbi:MAG: ABC transporter substrate-binding protein, partial [Casimicrobiaceae bacterium]